VAFQPNTTRHESFYSPSEIEEMAMHAHSQHNGESPSKSEAQDNNAVAVEQQQQHHHHHEPLCDRQHAPPGMYAYHDVPQYVHSLFHDGVASHLSAHYQHQQ
jgi:hypothetical protein